MSRKEYHKKWVNDNREHLKAYRRDYYKKVYIGDPNNFCCESIEYIENYELAKKDNFNGWVLHHRLETHTEAGERRISDLSRNKLIELDVYYNRPAKELIYLKNEEHSKLHNEHTCKLYKCLETGDIKSFYEWQKLGYPHAKDVAMGARNIDHGYHFKFVEEV